MGVVELLLAGEAGSDLFWAAVQEVKPSEVAGLLALVGHQDPKVRLEVVRTLPFIPGGDDPRPEMVAAAIRLSTDADPEVRDWACTALGEMWRDIDTLDLREALAARLDDEDPDTRCEALVGLAYRHDPRALPQVRAALSRENGDLWTLELVAAGALCDPTLHDLVLQHQEGWDDDDGARTADLVRRLTDPSGPGQDVLDGVADLSRRRARGEPDGDALAAWHVMNGLLDIAPHRAREFYQAVLLRLAGDEPAERELRQDSALAQRARDIPRDT